MSQDNEYKANLNGDSFPVRVTLEVVGPDGEPIEGHTMTATLTDWKICEHRDVSVAYGVLEVGAEINFSVEGVRVDYTIPAPE